MPYSSIADLIRDFRTPLVAGMQKPPNLETNLYNAIEILADEVQRLMFKVSQLESATSNE